MAAPAYIADGALSFAGGVNSIVVPTVQSQAVPDGIPRNVLPWLNNGSTRDGGISPRSGWSDLGLIQAASGLFQGAFPYSPISGATPYHLVCISGHILQVYADTNQVIDLTVKFNLFHPANQPFFHYVQAKQFAIIQAGDLVTLPLFWDGTTLRRSNGIVAPGSPTIYNVIFKNGWTVPAVGKSVVVNLNGVSYPGSNGDQVIMTGTITAPGGSFPIGGLYIGTFTVSAKDVGGVGNLTFTTVALGSTGGGQVSAGDSNAATLEVQNGPPPPVSEIPAATSMDYYEGRLWYAQNLKFIAGDITGGPSGTAAYNYDDALLKVTENPLAVGGDGFSIPEEGGPITALFHGQNLDTSLGQGLLYIGTRDAIYSLQVPVTRSDWIASGTSNQPQQNVVMITNGPTGDRSPTQVNADILFQTILPDIRSLTVATRFFGQWGNRSLSANELRVLQFVDRSLTQYASGINFNNRFLMTTLPMQTPQGVVHQGIIPLDFTPISNFGEGDNRPVWQGIYEGVNIFQLINVEYGGIDRAFAVVQSSTDKSFRLWELTYSNKSDVNVSGESRINWSIEFPAFTWDKEFLLKRLKTAQLWADRISGEVLFTMEYRPDGETCWLKWHQWKVCAARTSAEDCVNPTSYPITPFGPGYKQTMVLPVPPTNCEVFTGRASDIGYQFQTRLTIKGYCRIRGLMLFAEVVERPLFGEKVC